MNKELFLIGDPFCGTGAHYLDHCSQQLIKFLGPAKKGEIIVYVNAEETDAVGLPSDKAEHFFSKIGYSVIPIEEVFKSKTLLFQPEVKAFFVEGNDIYNLVRFLKQRDIFDTIANLVMNGQKKYIGIKDGVLIACPFIFQGSISMTIPWAVEGLNLVDFQIHQNYEVKPDESIARWFRKFYDLPLCYLSKSNWLRVAGGEVIQGG